MIDMYIMIWHLKFLNLKTILRPSMVGGMPLKHTHVVPSLSIGCTPWGPILGVVTLIGVAIVATHLKTKRSQDQNEDNKLL